MLHFFKKKWSKTPVNVIIKNLHDMIYSSWDIEQSRLKLIILGHFVPKNQKNQMKKFKKLLEISSFYTGVAKSQGDTEWNRQNSLSFWTFFTLLFPPLPSILPP